MINDIIVSVSRETRMVYLSKSFLGNDAENLQGNLIFKFKDEFVNGTARLEYSIGKEKKYAMLQKTEDSYVIPIQSAITKTGQNDFQLVITEGTDENAIPIFKSNIFYFYVGESLNVCPEEPEEYSQWIDVANTKLNKLDEAIEMAETLDITAEKVDNVAKVTVTRKSGSQEIIEIYDGETGPQGEQGIPGKDAVVNGVNTLTIQGGRNVEVEQIGNILTISSESGYDDTEIRQEIANLDIEVDGLTNNINEIVRTKADKSTTYTKDEVNELIGDIKTTHFQVVEEDLPEVGEENVIYLVPKQDTEFDDIYYEYIWVNEQYELIGSTQVDLSDYLTIAKFNSDKYDYVKDGLVNNTNQLTDEEQIKIEDWLGLAHNYLTYYNETPYQVSGDYVPAHKKYVDEKIGNIDTLLQSIDTGAGVE